MFLSETVRGVVESLVVGPNSSDSGVAAIRGRIQTAPFIVPAKSDVPFTVSDEMSVSVRPILRGSQLAPESVETHAPPSVPPKMLRPPDAIEPQGQA